MNNSKIKISKEKNATKGTDKNVQIQDFRLNESDFNPLIGKCFKKYRCDSFEYTNGATGIVGIYIDDKTFELRNEQKSIQYFDSVDDIALWTFKEVNANDIHSFFEDTNQIDTPVNEIVKKITLVNELQKVKISNEIYEMLITRAIIFHLETKDIYFEKDNTAFSEEIEIKRGHKLIDEFPKKNDFFLNQWVNGISSSVETEFVSLD